MSLSEDARKRLVIATTSRTIGAEIADALDAAAPENLKTQANLTLYVDSENGRDHYDGTEAAPLQTIQAAIDFLPEEIEHLAVIQLAEGTYSGAHTSKRFKLSEAGSGLIIRGTLIEATLASGVTEGTVTSAVAGTASSSTWGTLTLTSAGWTSNDLRGKFVEIVSGTGVGQIRPIDANTADTMTIAGSWTTVPTSSSTFAIRDCGSVLDTASAAIVGPNGATGWASTLLTFDCSPAGVQFDNYLQIEKLKFTGSAQAAVVVGGNCGLTAKWCSFGNSVNRAFSVLSMANSAGGLRVHWCYSNTTTSFISPTGFITGSLFLNQNVIAGTGSVVGVFTGNVSARMTSIQNSYRVLTAFNGTSETLSSFGDIINCLTTSGYGFNAATSANWVVSATGIYISNSTINGAAAAVNLAGRNQNAYLTGVAGTGNTVGIQLVNGAAAKVASNVTLTGTAEAKLDGTNSDLATMRAASPKLVTNTYGTIFHE